MLDVYTMDSGTGLLLDTNYVVNLFLNIEDKSTLLNNLVYKSNGTSAIILHLYTNHMNRQIGFK